MQYVSKDTLIDEGPELVNFRQAEMYVCVLSVKKQDVRFVRKPQLMLRGGAPTLLRLASFVAATDSVKKYYK